MAIITRWVVKALDYLTGLPPELEVCTSGKCSMTRGDMTECSKCHAFLPLANAKVLTHGIFCPECITLTPRHYVTTIAAVSGYMERIFADIIGYEDIKKEFVKALLSPKPVGILLIGPPGTCKSEFLRKIKAATPDRSEFIDGSYGSKAGIFKKLYENRPQIVLMDELDKLDRRDQEALLNLMETGILSKTTKSESFEIELNAWVFATGNNKENIMEPLFDRFETYFLSTYSNDEFRKVAVSRLRQEGVEDEELALYIANAVLRNLNRKSLRDAIRIARKSKTFEDVDQTVQTLKKYSKN